jgi:Glyoxalase-like domain
MEMERAFPQLRQVVLDCTDARLLAEFYRRLLGLRYRPGDEPPAAGEPDTAGRDWLVLQTAPAAPGWHSSKWRRCPRRPGRRVPSHSSCTWT